MIDNIPHIIVVDNAGDNSCLECHLCCICNGCNLGINEHFEYYYDLDVIKTDAKKFVNSLFDDLGLPYENR